MSESATTDVNGFGMIKTVKGGCFVTVFPVVGEAEAVPPPDDPEIECWFYDLCGLEAEARAIGLSARDRGREELAIGALELADRWRSFLELFSAGRVKGFPTRYSHVHGEYYESWGFELGRVGIEACSKGGDKGDKTKIPLTIKTHLVDKWIEKIEGGWKLPHSQAAKEIVRDYNKKTGRSISENKAPENMQEWLRDRGLIHMWKRDPRGRRPANKSPSKG